MIDYRELLKKYMRIVRGAEGITFVDSVGDPDIDEFCEITSAEVVELQAIEQEIRQ